MKRFSSGKFKLIVTSPPYDLGKEYESKTALDEYLKRQHTVIKECVRLLDDKGSICWQVGNYVENGEVIPLDTLLYPIFRSFGLRLRNRIVWHFGHGLHCKKRLSGRYETINWWTKSNNYTWNLDPICIPQEYPQKKYYKGLRAGEISENPKGKNHGDVWILPNVKSNHVEKTIHPCQYPVELAERLVLSMTHEWDSVFDPYVGVGSTVVGALMHKRNRFCVTHDAKLLRNVVAMTPLAQKATIEQQGLTAIMSYNQTDFVKDRVAVEVQMGKYSFVAHD